MAQGRRSCATIPVVPAVPDVVLMGDPRVAAVPVVECGEGLVDTRELPALESTPHQNPQNPDYAWMRRSLADRLVAARAALPAGLRLLITEGYRPYEQQAFFFQRRKQRFLDGDALLSEGDAHLRASAFISPPDVAPHVSGAAVDLTLMDERGRPLDMGSPIDVGPEESDGACYLDAENITHVARRNRDLLSEALTGAGLVNYPTEWWHWSYGDRYWALMTGNPHAIFGPVDSIRPGAVEPAAR